MHQHDDQPCTWTRAAYSLQIAMDRAQATAENAAKFSGMIDSAYAGTQGVAAQLIAEQQRISRDLGLIQEIAILAAGNPSFAEKLERLVEETKRVGPMSGDVPSTARRHRETRAGAVMFGSNRPLQDLLRTSTGA